MSDDIKDLISKATDAVEVAKNEPAPIVRYRTVKTVHRDKFNRIERVDEVQEPIDDAVEKVRRTAERLRTPDLIKMVKDILLVELSKRTDIPEADQRLSTAELADLDTDQ